MQSLVGIYREARRRKVFRTAALYIVGAWLALQVADTLFPGFGIPDSAIRALFWTAVLGFPLAVIFGWMFDGMRLFLSDYACLAPVANLRIGRITDCPSA